MPPLATEHEMSHFLRHEPKHVTPHSRAVYLLPATTFNKARNLYGYFTFTEFHFPLSVVEDVEPLIVSFSAPALASRFHRRSQNTLAVVFDDGHRTQNVQGWIPDASTTIFKLPEDIEPNY